MKKNSGQDRFIISARIARKVEKMQPPETCWENATMFHGKYTSGKAKCWSRG